MSDLKPATPQYLTSIWVEVVFCLLNCVGLVGLVRQPVVLLGEATYCIVVGIYAMGSMWFVAGLFDRVQRDVSDRTSKRRAQLTT